MKPPKSNWALLGELRKQLQETRTAEFETNRASMLALVEQLLGQIEEQNRRTGSTLQILEEAFLTGVTPGNALSNEEQARRFGELENRISGLNEAGVLWLFSRLEYLAANRIYALYALAQTVNPARIKEQCEWLPDSLVRDANRALKAEKIKAGDTMTKKGKSDVRAAWIEAGLHQRRANRGELKEFCNRMAGEHQCSPGTISNNWIPAWRRELPST